MENLMPPREVTMSKDHERIKKLFVFIGDGGSKTFKQEVERLTENVVQYLYKHGGGSPIRGYIIEEMRSW